MRQINRCRASPSGSSIGRSPGGSRTAGGRIVDADVVDRHLIALRATVDDGRLALEGFDQVIVLRTAQDVAAVSIERVPR